MKHYEAPFCEVDRLETETSFLTGASGGGFPADPKDPFSNSSGIIEEDEDE